ncbi:DUF3810 domain-containing protein [uncultured Flavobacterium sp.]|uniref:DUF3810 domain-containing protein n=1 Tax=uncultured Flavobacterium sp. TaxID=165435 RepID=UPI0029316D62|nr:DUF3810 domain-containing protein [uncultured Flavobacterium sp.]
MKQKHVLPLFLLIQIIVLRILRYFPEFVENVYSNGFYLKLSHFSRIILGKIPFSVGDLIYSILILFLIRWIWKTRKTWKLQWKDHLLKILSVLSIFYFFFHVFWALNYYREPLFEKMDIQREYSDAELLAFTKKLITKTNEIQFQITKNDSSKIVFPYSQNEAFQMNLNGYKNLTHEHSFFKYEILSVKKSLFSLPLTYMGFGGYLNPFTNEAQVNDLLPMYNFPLTSCHEMAHQMGFASESECNFIGVLANLKNNDLYYKYSGYSFMLHYCLSIWKFKNEKIFQQLKKSVHDGILKNYQESYDFWKKYQTPIETGFEIFYDNFLKTNNQKDGMDSYSKFIDLTVNYYKTRPL